MKFYTSVVRRSNDILIREIDQGKSVHRSILYRPSLFVPAALGSRSKYRTINNQQVDRVALDNIADANAFLLQKSQRNESVYGMERWIYVFLNDEYPGQIEYDPKLITVGYLDIETKSDAGFPDIEIADQPITAITLVVGDRVLSFGLGPYKATADNIAYRRCGDETELLSSFLDVWQREMPDILSGWNTDGFDIPYLVNRITAVLGLKEARRLSPWKILDNRTIFLRGEETKVRFPLGISSLDYMRLYKKLVLKPRESYSLNHISSVELGEGKLDYSEYATLTTLYRENHQKFMEYNIRDTLLVQRLEQRLRLIELTYAVAYDAKINYEDILFSSRSWDARIHNHLMDHDIVVPARRSGLRNIEGDERDLVGGWVKVPKPQQYRWVVSVDVKSEYPSIIMQYNISPETFLGKLETKLTVDDIMDGKIDDLRNEFDKQDAVIAANLCLYARGAVGFLPILLGDMFKRRQDYRQKELDAKTKYEALKNEKDHQDAVRFGVLQMALKVSLNAGYGCLSNEYFRWYNINNAEAVTTTGQLTIRWAAREINKYLNKVLQTKDEDFIVGADTDSCYVNLEKLVNMSFDNNPPESPLVVDFIDQICKEKLEPLLDKSFKELARYMNATSNRISMKREKICDKVIWNAAKNYVLRVYDSEGVRFATPKIDVVGIKAVMPSTPEPSRKAFYSALHYVLNEERTNLIKFVDDFRDKFHSLSLEEIAAPRSITGLDKYGDVDTLYKSHCPIQVRGALVYNRMLQHHKVTEFPPIYDGDKARFCYLKTPNPTGENVITVVTALPKVFDLEKYVDHYTMFEKTFYEPLRTILDTVGWKTEEEGSLEAFL